MSKVYAFKCETCGREDREGKGWGHISAAPHGGRFQGSYIDSITMGGSPPSALLKLSGSRSLQTSSTIDLCSPECAGKWVFG